MSVATSNFAKPPSLTSVSLDTTEFPTNIGDKSTHKAIKELIVTPALGVKNSNPIIEEAIEGFNFLYSEPKPRDSKIKFGESRTITFDTNEEVDKLVGEDGRNTRNQLVNGIPGKAILKLGAACTPDSESQENESTESVLTLLQRIFTLHGIPACEIRQDLTETLQIFVPCIVKSFKEREECYKYVGRKECIDELEELEYWNDNLQCELTNLEKKLNNERVKWEVVDEVFAENDSLKIKIEKLMNELHFAPKWEDVDGLLEENKELNSQINQLTSVNNELKEKYSHLDTAFSRLVDENERSKEKIQVELRESTVKLNESIERVTELQKENGVLNSSLCTLSRNSKQIESKLEEAKNHIQDLSIVVDDYRNKSDELTFLHQQLIEKSNESDLKLRHMELANVELVSAKAELTSKLYAMKRTIDCSTDEKFQMKKKMKLMKKKAYNRFFDENVSLKCKNEEFAGELEKLRKNYEDISLSNTELAAKQHDLVLVNLEAETRKSKQFERDFMATQNRVALLDLNLKRERPEKNDVDTNVCQSGGGDLTREIDLQAAEDNSMKGLQKIGQLRNLFGENYVQLVQNAEKWKKEDHSHLQQYGMLQEERTKLLKKCSRLEFEKTRLQMENDELSGNKKDYSLFDEKYEWLESIALSLRQEKKCCESQIKNLQKKLKDAKKTIDSMEKAKFQYERKPQNLQIQLDQSKLQNFELCQRFSKKDKELQESFDKMREMAIMLRSTMTLAKTLNTGDEVTLSKPSNRAENSLRTFLPLKWWKTST